MTNEEFTAKASRIYEFIQKELPDGHYCSIHCGTWSLEFLDSQKRRQIINQLSMDLDMHEIQLGEEVSVIAQNN